MMPDFLRGMLSAKAMRDPGMDMMRAAAGEDYRQQLRQRRAGRELPGFLQGDPAAELNLAAMGIGRGPESQRERSRFEDAIARQTQQDVARQEKSEWEKSFAITGRDLAASRAAKSEEARARRFEEEMGFRKETAEKADLRARAKAEADRFEKLEAEGIRKEEKAYRRKRDAEAAARAADSARMQQERHNIIMRDVEREAEDRAKQEAVMENNQKGIQSTMMAAMDKYMGTVSPEQLDTPQGAMLMARKIKMQDKLMSDYKMFGGDSNKVSVRMDAMTRALEENFGPQIEEEAFARELDMMSKIKLQKALDEETFPARFEAALKKQKMAKEKLQKAEKAKAAKMKKRLGKKEEELRQQRRDPGWVPGLRPGSRRTPSTTSQDRSMIETLLRSAAGPAGLTVDEMLGF
jgi:hypothetical protein